MQNTGDHDQDGNAPSGVRSRFGRLLGNRPLSVYGVLVAGAGVLVLLLLVIIVTGRGTNPAQESITCLGIDRAEAETAINTGLVERISIVTEQGKPERGPLAVTFYLVDGNCRRLPEGVPAQPDLYRIIGVLTVFNQTRAGEQRVNVRWEQQANIPNELLATATATPTVTPLPTPTPRPTETPIPPTETPIPPTETPVPPPTDTPVPPPTETPVPPLPTAAPQPAPAGDQAAPPPVPAPTGPPP